MGISQFVTILTLQTLLCKKVFGFLLGVVILEIMGNLKGRWCILVTL